MTFIVATNVIASRPPERRPTGTLVPINCILCLVMFQYPFLLGRAKFWLSIAMMYSAMYWTMVLE